MPYLTNDALDALARLDANPRKRGLRRVLLKRGELLGRPGQPIKDVYFPTTSMISLVVELSTGDRIESAIVGQRNMVGGGAALGQQFHTCTAVVQIPGSAEVMSAPEVAEIAAVSAPARVFLHAHEQYFRAQAQQTAACNAKHHIPGRLCTWLLRARDALGSTTFDITQELVAEMLGVQRASVSMVASSLQNADLISYRRGHIHIADEARLKEAACECYRALERQHQLLFGEAPRVPAAAPGRLA